MKKLLTALLALLFVLNMGAGLAEATEEGTEASAGTYGFYGNR